MSNKQTGNILRSRGRPKGSPNKVTGALKEAILNAGKEVGEDGKGKGGLTGYLRKVAQEDIKAFSGLLGKVLPLQVTGDDENPIRHDVEVRIVDPR